MKSEDVPESMKFDDRPVVECLTLAELEAAVDSILLTGNRHVKLKFPPALLFEAYDILQRLFPKEDPHGSTPLSQIQVERQAAQEGQEGQEAQAPETPQAPQADQATDAAGATPEALVVQRLTPVPYRGLVYVIEQHGPKYWAMQDLGQAGVRLLWDFSFDDLADAELHAAVGLDMILDPGEPPS